ncbi:MAG: glycosyltransferase [Candidatus Aminicenantes bacterium]|nr:glycosyltransferase [Candidatus Aminicenantes bacterium]
MKKPVSVLLCTYSFPPLGGPRALRWLNLLNGLHGMGWDVDVLTIRPSEKDNYYDAGLLRQLSAGIGVYRSFPGPYYHLMHSMKNSVRGFSKTTLEWLPFGIAMGRTLVRKKEYGLILSSALPFVGHMVAADLKKRTGLPWIADYGDPLGFNPISSPLKRKIGGKIERKILAHVDGLVVPFQEMKDEFLREYNFLKPEIVTAIGQGIPDSIADIQPRDFGNRFVLCYVGSFYTNVHEPYQIFQALENLSAERDFQEAAHIIIAGNTEQKYIDHVRRMNIRKNVSFLGQVPFDQAVGILKGASAILYIGGRRSDYHFPSKVLISAAANRPIIAIQQSNTDLGAQFIQKQQLGVVVPNIVQEIEAQIKRYFVLWKKNQLDTEFRPMQQDMFFWKNRARELEEFIRRILKRKIR